MTWGIKAAERLGKKTRTRKKYAAAEVGAEEGVGRESVLWAAEGAPGQAREGMVKMQGMKPPPRSPRSKGREGSLARKGSGGAIWQKKG